MACSYKLDMPFSYEVSVKSKYILLVILAISITITACGRKASNQEMVEVEIENIDNIENIIDDKADVKLDAKEPERELLPDEEFNLVTDMYTEPILMNPTEDAIEVVWFTEEEGGLNQLHLFLHL